MIEQHYYHSVVPLHPRGVLLDSDMVTVEAIRVQLSQNHFQKNSSL